MLMIHIIMKSSTKIKNLFTLIDKRMVPGSGVWVLWRCQYGHIVLNVLCIKEAGWLTNLRSDLPLNI